MPLKFPKKKFIQNWLKAFMLSPGVLFPAGYLVLYFSINIYLNADFKNNLSQSVNRATGNTWQTSITSLRSGLVLDTVTLNHIELTRVRLLNDRVQNGSHTITINTIEIPIPSIQKLLYSPAERLSTTNALCEKILAEKRSAQ
ncbi:MAG: hypothetical protein HKK67_02970 [Chlorobiaceae bacterium]|nr:hypothetical protein [Chlorobiaceae bacterium]